MPALNQITYIGHATTLIELDGLRILTDPLLRERAFHLHRRSLPVNASRYQDIDAILISHLHLDHCDIPSLRMLGREIHLIVPSGAADLFRKRGFTNITEMHVGETVKFGELMIEATYAEHQSFFPPFGPSTESIGFLIKGSHNIYFPGDSDIFPGMTELANNLDVALLPVWGWGPNLGPGHMNPERAAHALTLLRPRIAIPIHWGTFYPRGLGWFRRQTLSEPPQLFYHYASVLVPEIDIQILQPGSVFIFPVRKLEADHISNRKQSPSP